MTGVEAVPEWSLHDHEVYWSVITERRIHSHTYGFRREHHGNLGSSMSGNKQNKSWKFCWPILPTSFPETTDKASTSYTYEKQRTPGVREPTSRQIGK